MGTELGLNSKAHIQYANVSGNLIAQTCGKMALTLNNDILVVLLAFEKLHNFKNFETVNLS